MSLYFFTNMPIPVLGENITVYCMRTSAPIKMVLMYVSIKYHVLVIDDHFCTNADLLEQQINDYLEEKYEYPVYNYISENHKQTSWNLTTLKLVVLYNPPLIGEKIENYIYRLTGVRYSYIGSMSRVCETIFGIYDVIINPASSVITPFMSDTIKKSEKTTYRYEYEDQSGNKYISDKFTYSGEDSRRMSKNKVGKKKSNLSILVEKNKPYDGQLVSEYHRIITGRTNSFSSERRQAVSKLLILHHNVKVELRNKAYTIIAE